MKPELWEARRQRLEQFSGKGFDATEVAERAGLSVATVRTYAKKYGFDFSPPNHRMGEIKDCIERGLTVSEAASEMGMRVGAIYFYAHKLGMRFKRSGTGPANPSRVESMEAMFRAGATLQAIGNVFGVSRERVRQLLSKHRGIVAHEGGKAVSSRMQRDKKRAAKDAVCIEKHGCTYAQLSELRAYARDLRANGETEYRTPIRAFCSQRGNAQRRGLEWNLKLWDWWTVWQKSGKWGERGRARDAYVMCRLGDAGAYEVGNVYIATLRHNSEIQPNNPYRSSHPDHDTAVAALKAHRADEQDRAAA